MKQHYSFGYFVACFWYVISIILHRIYQFVVFLSKPGAALIVLYLAHAITLYLHFDHQGLPTIEMPGDMESNYNIIRTWLTYGAISRGPWIYLEIPLLALAVFLHLLSVDFLRAILGLFPAKARPLPPVPKLKAESTRISSVRASIIVRPKKRGILETGKDSALLSDVVHILNR